MFGLRKSYGMFSWSPLILLGFVAAYLYTNSTFSMLRDIREKGGLTVYLQNSPTSYYEGPEGYRGFEYELLSAFAEYAELDIHFFTCENAIELLSAAEHGYADISAGGITRTEQRDRNYTFGPDYYHVQQVLIYKRGERRPQSIEDLLDGSIEIMAGSSYEEQLKTYQKEYPDLSWIANEELSTELIMQKVWEEKVDYTIADDNIAQLNQRYFPELEIAFPITEEQPQAWVLNPKWKKLSYLIDTWLTDYVLSGKMDLLVDKYYGHVTVFDYVDIRKYHRRINSRLPNFERYFRSAAEETGLSWTLLAAMAYQESHWRSRAKSPTGVRGIMMLTLCTARNVGVTNRLDPEQSIRGGAKYLAHLVDQIPDSVRAEDHIPYALASYNVGMGHVQDAQILADQMGYDPNRWMDIREVLPLLTQKKYYQQVKHGYARGYEPVLYVNRILNYRDILETKLGYQK